MGKIAKQIGVLNLEKVRNRLLKRALISLKFFEWRFILSKDTNTCETTLICPVCFDDKFIVLMYYINRR